MKIRAKFRQTRTDNIITIINFTSIILILIISIISSTLVCLLSPPSSSSSSSGSSSCICSAAVRLAGQSSSQLFAASSSPSLENQRPLARQRRFDSAAPNSNNQPPVPYKTFYVSRACEWKSNLFVPKTNDILFAQSSHFQQQQQQQQQQPQESSVSYFDTHQASATTFNTANANSIQSGNYNNNYFNSRQQSPQATVAAAAEPTATSAPLPDVSGNYGGGRTVLLSTDSKALVLALPLQLSSQTFAGYEPACSIRLIVPRNMRILAKLSSRRLTFAQEQQLDGNTFGSQVPQFVQPDDAATTTTFVGQQPPQKSLWLNVSQNQFIETEQRIIETEGNILALRFLLDRFANKQQPDLRFQLVLTAFQTLGENSDLSGIQQTSRPTSSLEQQIICDQQRLIAANLACDGFKNCQDGHDEEASTCALLNNSPRTTWQQQQQPAPPPIGSSNQRRPNETEQQASILVRVWNFGTRQDSSAAGFFLGFLLILLILGCCTCCAYFCLFAVWRRYCLRRNQQATAQVTSSSSSKKNAPSRRQRNIQLSLASGEDDDDDDDEAESLARAQNFENAARQQQQQTKQMPPRLHSILKRPGSTTRPMEAPPAIPAANRQQQQQQNRGALSSHLASPSLTAQRDFRPTPAKRLTRPTRPVPIPAQQTTPTIRHDRPTTTTTTTATNQPVAANSATTTTTTSSSYSYSSVGTIRYSEHTSYYGGEGQLVTGPVAPPSGQDRNYASGDNSRRDPQSGSVSPSPPPRASLI